MRQVLLFAFFMLASTVATAQSNGQVKVVRNDGTTIIGTIQSADSSGITLTIGGIAMTIPMAEVQSIEECSSPAEGTQSYSSPFAALPSDQYGDYVITDYASYPESFTITVAGQTFTMILVRGGVFNMGYDDWHSRAMSSEPVHKVAVSSFYVSDDYVVPSTKEKDKSPIDAVYARRYVAENADNTGWEGAKRMVDGIAETLGAPYRLLTEAEWEYAAIGPEQERIFSKTYKKKGTKSTEWCQDLWGSYSAQRQENPTGPTEGKAHVARRYSEDHQKWGRYHSSKGHVRIAISADKISEIIE